MHIYNLEQIKNENKIYLVKVIFVEWRVGVKNKVED